MAYTLKSLIKGASVLTAGQLLTKASSFFLLPLYTRFLTPVDYGIIGYVEVIGQLLSTILMFGFYGAQTRFYYEYRDNPQKTGSFLFSINVYLLVVLVFTCSFLTRFGNSIYMLISDNRTIPFFPYFPIVIWSICFQILNQMVISFSLASKKFMKCAVLQFIQFLCTTGSVIFFVVYLRQGALGQLKGILFGNILFFLVFYWNYAKNFYFHFSFEKLKYALAFGIPIVFHLITSILHVSIDRVILQRFVPLANLGIYTLGYQLGMVMAILVSSTSQAWTPHYYDLMQDPTLDQAYHTRKMFYLWLIGMGTICLIGSLWSREMLLFLTPERFHPSASIVPIILFSYTVEILYFAAIKPISFYKQTKFFPLITGSSALVNISLNFLFIPRFEILGAAYATAISYGYMGIVAYLIGRRLFNPGYNLAKILLFFLGLFVGSVLITFQRISLGVELIKISIMIGFIGMSYVLFRDYVRPVIKTIRGFAVKYEI